MRPATPPARHGHRPARAARHRWRVRTRPKGPVRRRRRRFPRAPSRRHAPHPPLRAPVPPPQARAASSPGFVARLCRRARRAAPPPPPPPHRARGEAAPGPVGADVLTEPPDGRLVRTAELAVQAMDLANSIERRPRAGCPGADVSRSHACWASRSASGQSPCSCRISAR